VLMRESASYFELHVDLHVCSSMIISSANAGVARETEARLALRPALVGKATARLCYRRLAAC